MTVKRPKGYRGAKQNEARRAQRAPQIVDEALVLASIKHLLGDDDRPRGSVRWRDLAKRGASSAEVREILGAVLGISGGTTGPGGPGSPYVRFWGGKVPRITVGGYIDKSPARLVQGAELVRAVRWLYKIPEPGQRWSEDRDALEHGALKPTWGDHTFGRAGDCGRCGLKRRILQRRSSRRRDDGALVRVLEVRRPGSRLWTAWTTPTKPPPCTPAKRAAQPAPRAARPKKPALERAIPAGGYIKKCLSIDWWTPPELLAPVRAVLGDPIPLDPATAASNPTRAARFHTIRDDGLSHAWDAPWFCNPPYGRRLRAWLAKIVLESITWHGGMPPVPGLALLPCSRWEQGYLHDLLRAATAVCFVRRRVKFVKAKTGDAVGGTPNASMFLAFNVDPAAFGAAFRDVGLCLRTSAL